MGLPSAWSILKKAADSWVSQPLQKPTYRLINSTNDESSVLSGQEFAPGASYFSVRMVEMNLAEGRRYLVDFLLLAVCLSECTIGTERQRAPLILSNQTSYS